MAAGSAQRRETRTIAALLLAGIVVYVIDLIAYSRHGEVLAYGISYVGNFINADPDMVRRDIGGLSYYPPLYYAFLYLVHAAVGLDFMRHVQASALLVPAGAVYLAAFARRLGMGVWSFVPGVLLLCLPGTVRAETTLSIEMPLVLIVPAFAYHLHAAERFRVARHAVLAGLWAGLGLLTKWTFPIYVVGLVLLVLVLSTLSPATDRPRFPQRAQWANLGLLVLAAVVVSGWWYARNMRWSVLVASAQNDPGYLEVTYLRSLGDYVLWLGRAVAGSWPRAATAAVALGLVVGRRPLPYLAALGLGVALPLLILALPIHGEARYLYPLFPAAALAIAWPAARARSAALRLGLAVVLIAATLGARQATLADEARRFRQFGVTDGADHNLRFNPPGIRPRADRVADALLALFPDRRARSRRVAIHPLYFNYHLYADYLRYEIAKRDATANFEVPFYSAFDYGLLRDDLRAGVLDVVAADCGPKGDCLAMDRQMTEDFVARTARYGHIDQTSGVVTPTFTMDDVKEDLAILDRDYRRTPVLDLGDGTHAFFWLRRTEVPHAVRRDPYR